MAGHKNRHGSNSAISMARKNHRIRAIVFYGEFQTEKDVMITTVDSDYFDPILIPFLCILFFIHLPTAIVAVVFVVSCKDLFTVPAIKMWTAFQIIAN